MNSCSLRSPCAGCDLGVVTASAAARRLLPEGITSVVPLRLLALYTTDLSVLADEMGLVLAEPATANTVVVVPQDGAVLTDQVAPLALALADLFTLPGHGDAEAEQLRDALARTEQAWEACCTSTPEYVLARSALLDPLAALDAHLDNLILVGAQAIYHHTGDADLNVPLLTTC